jgi:hypothetical protein
VGVLLLLLLLLPAGLLIEFYISVFSFSYR